MSRTDSNSPPYQVTPAILSLVEQIGEALGRIQVADPMAGKPHLHRINRFRHQRPLIAPRSDR